MRIAPRSLPRWATPDGWMPLNIRGAVGWLDRAGLGAVAVVIGRSVVPGLTIVR